jgi:hypothetical protein
VPRWSKCGGDDELQCGLGYFVLVDRLQRLGYGELRVKALHRPRLMTAMSLSLDVAPLIGGIVEKLHHLPRRFRASDSLSENLSLGFGRSGQQRHLHRLPLVGVSLVVWYPPRQSLACSTWQLHHRLGGCAVSGPMWISKQRLRILSCFGCRPFLHG